MHSIDFTELWRPSSACQIECCCSSESVLAVGVSPPRGQWTLSMQPASAR
jgi:hypothetical protein